MTDQEANEREREDHEEEMGLASHLQTIPGAQLAEALDLIKSSSKQPTVRATLTEAARRLRIFKARPLIDHPLCDMAPPGWRCTRLSGHSGPCAAERVHVERPPLWTFMHQYPGGYFSQAAYWRTKEEAERNRAMYALSVGEGGPSPVYSVEQPWP